MKQFFRMGKGEYLGIIFALSAVFGMLNGCGKGPSGNLENALAAIAAPRGQVEARPAAKSAFHGVKEKDPLFSGDMVRTGKNASTQIVFQDKIVVSLQSLTSFELNGADHELGKQNEGTAVYQMEKQTSETRIAVPNGTTAILGTTFCLAVSTDSTKLWVEEGKVRFSLHANGSNVVVSSGTYLEVRRDAKELATPTTMSFFDREKYFSKDLLQEKIQINR